MTWTLEQYNALKDAIAKGVTQVRYQDRWITYRSIDEMLKILNLMAKELGLVDKCGRLYAKTNKGLCNDN